MDRLHRAVSSLEHLQGQSPWQSVPVVAHSDLTNRKVAAGSVKVLLRYPDPFLCSVGQPSLFGLSPSSSSDLKELSAQCSLLGGKKRAPKRSGVLLLPGGLLPCTAEELLHGRALREGRGFARGSPGGTVAEGLGMRSGVRWVLLTRGVG